MHVVETFGLHHRNEHDMTLCRTRTGAVRGRGRGKGEGRGGVVQVALQVQFGYAGIVGHSDCLRVERRIKTRNVKANKLKKSTTSSS